MAILAKKTGNDGDFELCPVGLYDAVCVDVVDLGLETTTWQGKTKSQHKVRIVWLLGKVQSTGKPFQAMKKYTLSLSDKATLRADLESWRGKPFTEEELNGFDLERLIGAPCRILINHYQGKGDGKTRHGVQSLIKAEGKVNINTAGYVRKKDRPSTQAAAAPSQEREPGVDEDLPEFNEEEDIPF